MRRGDVGVVDGDDALVTILCSSRSMAWRASDTAESHMLPADTKAFIASRVCWGLSAPIIVVYNNHTYGCVIWPPRVVLVPRERGRRSCAYENHQRVCAGGEKACEERDAPGHHPLRIF